MIYITFIWLSLVSALFDSSKLFAQIFPIKFQGLDSPVVYGFIAILFACA